MVVVDTNVLVHFMFEDEKSPWTRSLRFEDAQWILPELWRHEFLNVLATISKSGRDSLVVLTATWIRAEGLFNTCERKGNAVAALEMAASLSISGYDAQFLTLARQLGTVLVTEDRELLKKAPHLTRPLSYYQT